MENEELENIASIEEDEPITGNAQVNISCKSSGFQLPWVGELDVVGKEPNTQYGVFKGTIQECRNYIHTHFPDMFRMHIEDIDFDHSDMEY